MLIRANHVDIRSRRIYPAEIEIKDKKIYRISEIKDEVDGYVFPGFVDAHVHIESSMLTPKEFGRIAVQHGTVATVSDPHEIANVLGIDGVDFMVENADETPLKIFFGAPSCVPATSFETSGAVIDEKDIEQLLHRPDIWYLSEMMNYPGVIYNDQMVRQKLKAASDIGKPIDGHAPGLVGEQMHQYFSKGITTDHECFTQHEGRAKALIGVNILIREGSAAKNYEALIPLINEFPEQIMFCSDDKHPDDLLEGHINRIAARALQDGYDLFDTLYAACIKPVIHYGIPVGTLRIGDPADFVICDDLSAMSIERVIIDGDEISPSEKINPIPANKCPNRFSRNPVSKTDFTLPQLGQHVNVIVAKDGELITDRMSVKLTEVDSLPNVEKDILKIAVVNRYKQTPVVVGLIHGFGLTHGAIASSVAHDSHNVVVIGQNDEAMVEAVNNIILTKGGISAVGDKDSKVLPLPVAGLMSNLDVYSVATAYKEIDQFAKIQLGSGLTAPFMTLSFMALLVIPALKIGDLGLFDGNQFKLIPLSY